MAPLFETLGAPLPDQVRVGLGETAPAALPSVSPSKRIGRASPPGRDLIWGGGARPGRAIDQIEEATNMAEPTTRGVTRQMAEMAFSKRARKMRIIGKSPWGFDDVG
jgi:hypothetical protein